MKKRLTSMILAIAMILSLGVVPTTAFADESVTGVTVTSETAIVLKSGTLQFSATVAGESGDHSNQNVTWSIVEDVVAGTSITEDGGLLTVAASETAATLTVRATSDEDNSKSGTATVTLTDAATVTSVTVTPDTVSVQKGKTQSFSADVTGENNPSTDVTWSIDETVAAGTSISEAGELTVDKDETVGTLTIRATSDEDNSKSGTATVTLTVAASVTSVTVTPDTVSVQKGKTQSFSADVTGENNPSTDVTWSIDETVAAGTSISEAGELTVDKDETVGTLTIRATSDEDNSKSGTATVTLTVAASVTSVTVTPDTVSVQKGKTQSFSADVTGENNPSTDVTWSIDETVAAGTSISEAGELTVDKDETVGTLTIRATSDEDNSKSGTATVTLTVAASVTSVTVTPDTVSVQKGKTQSFSADVTGENNPSTDVTWSIDESVVEGTSINEDGVLTVAAGETATELTVTATSVADTDKSGTATVTVTEATAAVTLVSVSPDTASVNLGEDQSFSATVEGENSPSEEVTWSVEGASSESTKFNDNVLTVGLDETSSSLTVKAISVADGTKSGTATVTIPANEPVTINDYALKIAICKQLGVPSADWNTYTVTVGDMESLTELDASNAGITDLTGLWTAVNLVSLNLSGNPLNDAKRNSDSFIYSEYWPFSSLNKLENLNLSNCRLGDFYPYAPGAPHAFGGLGTWTILPSLKTLDLSDNGLTGGFDFPSGVFYDNLISVNLSGNRLTAVDIDIRYFTNLASLDISDNCLYWNELAGSWFEGIVEAGEIVDRSNQKNLAELHSLLIVNQGYDISDYTLQSTLVTPDSNGIFECGGIVGNSVTFSAYGYAGGYMKITVDGGDKFTATPTELYAEIKQENNYYVLSGLEPGDYEITLDVLHLNGDAKQYIMRVSVADIPNEGEDSAGIVDVNMHYELCKKLGISDPATHVITKTEMATLTGRLNFSYTANISNLEGIQYASQITELIAYGPLTEIPALPDSLTSLILNGEFTTLPALPAGLTSLQLTGNFTSLPDLPSGLTKLSLTGDNYNEFPAFPEGLTYLKLEGTFSVTPNVSNLTGLTYLKIDSEALTAPVDVSYNTALETYDMSAATDGTLSDLSGLSSLAKLYICYARGTVQPPGLADCTSLSRVYINDFNEGTYLMPCAGDKAVDIYVMRNKADVEDIAIFDISSTNGAANTWEFKSYTNVQLNGASDSLACIDATVNFGSSFSASNLTELTLKPRSYRDIEGMNRAFEHMPNLKTLDMLAIELTEMPQGIEALTKLEELSFSSSEITTLADLSKCVSLKTITAHNAPLASLDTEMLPVSLTTLDLYSTEIKRITGTFAHLTNLTSLSCAQSPLIEFPDIRDATALQMLAIVGYYAEIPTDMFDKLNNLMVVQLGCWIPTVISDGQEVPAPGTSAATAIAKLKEVSPYVYVLMWTPNQNPFFPANTNSFSGLLELKSDTGTVEGEPYITRNLTMVVPAGTQSITLTPQAVLEDTTITIGDQTVDSGEPIRIDGLQEGTNTFTIRCENSFENHYLMDTETIYTLKVIVGEYTSTIEEGRYYQVKISMKKTGTNKDSMSGGYIQPNVIVRLENGRYEVRFTVSSSSSIPYVGYYYTGETAATQAEKLSTTDDDQATYRIYTATLDERLIMRLFPSPMGYYVEADMVFDTSAMIDVTETMPSVDKTYLMAAINKAEAELDKTIYTDASYNALKTAYDAAKAVYADDEAIQTEVDAALDAVNNAIDGLKIDQSKLADKTSLKAVLDKAKAITKGDHTDTAWNALQEAISDAQEVYDLAEATQSEVDAVEKSLETAITVFNNSGSASELDKDNLPDGTYTLNANMIKINRKDYSMSNDAIDHTVTLTVENGVYYITVAFKGLNVEGSFGYLSRLKYYGEGFSYDSYGNPEGTVIPGTVLAYQTDSNGNIVVDQYNDASNPYPKYLRFPLVNKANYDGNYVPLQVYVPIMEAISTGSGTQDVLMQLDWTTLKAGSTAEIPTEPVNQGEETAADKSALSDKLAEAKAIEQGDYTDDSYESLQTTITTAQAIMDSQYATQTEVDEQVTALTEAIEALVERPEETLDKDNLEDGKYEVRVNLWHATQNKASMGNSAINRTALIEVINGKMYMSISGHPIQVGTITASILSLQIKQANGGYVYADVIANNIEGGKPSAFRFALPSTNTYIEVKVDPQVEVMGDDPVDARLRISWDTLVSVSDDATVSSNTTLTVSEDGVLSDATSLVDLETGVKLEADENVLPEGATMSVTRISSGEEYEKATVALEDVQGNFVLYDITLLGEDAAAVQPNGTVKVSIPVPEGLDEGKIAIYRINDDGTKTLIESSVEDGYVVFYTNHFSLYAIVEKAEDVDEAEEEESALAGTADDTNTDGDTVKELESVPEAATAGSNGAAFLWWLIPIALIAAGVTIFIVRRKLKTQGTTA